MAVAFTSLKVGDIIYDCHRHRVGNTMATELGIWKVRILEINLKERKVLVSWNDNTPQWKNELYFIATTIKRNPPEWVHRISSMGTICYMCGAKKSDGHRPDCTHPKAKTVRKEPSTCSDQSV
jgi:hypothetical protein